MKVYNKLVRDKIIEIIEGNSAKPTFHIADNKEYQNKLYQKLLEEVNELIETPDSKDEMSDVLEVLYSIFSFNNTSFEEIEEIRKKKEIDRGGFKKRIILESVEDNT